MVGVAVLAVALALADIFEWPSADHAPNRPDFVVFVVALASLWVIASVLASLRSQRAWAELGNFRAQELFRETARRLAPPAVAAALTLNHTSRTGDAVAVFVAMLLATIVMTGTRYPLHLAGVARLVYDFVMPAVGIGAALLGAGVWNVPLELQAMVVPLLGAWFVTFAGGWLEETFNSERPIRMAVIGEPKLAGALALEMENEGVRDHTMLGWVSDDTEGATAIHEVGPDIGHPELAWLGPLSNIRAVVLSKEIDLLVMAPSPGTGDIYQATVESCVDLPVRMVQAARLYEEMHGRVPIGAINEAWFAYLMHPRFSPQAAWSKRLMDLLVSGVLLVLLLPLFTIVAALVKLGDRGPVLYRQRRVGAGGREFDVLKFRTMQADAEEVGRPQWAQAADPRVTRIGKYLRASHLDEMPQLLNVLGGSMSLVGPRPERPEFVAELEKKIPYYSRRVLVNPGITGWAQVRSGYSGSELGTAFKLCHDLYYIKHRSLVFDLLTLVETVRTLVADVQYGHFTFSEAFILGPTEVAQEAAVLGKRAVLGDTALLAEEGHRRGVKPERIPGAGDPRTSGSA